MVWNTLSKDELIPHDPAREK
ncbi:MAG: hypothetical protein UR39_C0004G0073, partial [Candidatus Woesebacteria bacterium GW2011_GWA1_33_30]